MVIDDFFEWKECNEKNNVKALHFQPSFDVHLQPDTSEALIREGYEVDYFVENLSKLRVEATIDMLSITDVFDKTPTNHTLTSVVLEPGEAWELWEYRSHDWDWVSPESPMDAVSLTDYLQAAVEDAISLISGAADTILDIKDTAKFIAETYAF